MSNISIKRFSDRESLFEAVAIRCQQQLSNVIAEQGIASFIVPGGSTPAPVFERLSKTNLDWKNITIALSDERWLERDHQQSNQRLIESTLLINQAKNARFVAMKNEIKEASLGEKDCNFAYQKILSPFSLTLLGMGADGHFASLFPGINNLESALAPDNEKQCISIDATGSEVAGDYPERMSLTLSAILKSEVIVLLITGKEKLKVIENSQKESSSKKYPISKLINQKQSPVEIYWCE